MKVDQPIKAGKGLSKNYYNSSEQLLHLSLAHQDLLVRFVYNNKTDFLKTFTFRRSYFFLTITFLLIEVMIAVFVKDRFIRPYLGDFLVVILLYCFLRAFFNISVNLAAVSVLLFAYLIETSQYFHLIVRLGLEHSKLASAVLGWSFAWADIIAYTLGIITVVFIEKYTQRRNQGTYHT